MFNFGNGGAVGTTFTTVTNPLITSDEVWDGKYYVPDFMIVTVDNATLDLTNVDIVFGECAGIEFIDGAQLRANNSVFRPCAIDGVWRGLDFYVTDPALEGPTAIINECTFKNAQRAIHGFEHARIDIRITNNLFSNCRMGVAITNGTFMRSITGNTFLLDDLVPDLNNSQCGWNSADRVGIHSRNINYRESISQNDFIAPDYTTDQFFGVLSIADRNISVNSNNFSNTFQSVLLQGDRNAKVESNEIHVTHSFLGYEHQIAAISCMSTLIGDNDIVNSSQYQITNWAGNNSAIYCFLGEAYDVKENRIDGFETGIQCERLRNIHITDNEIGNCYFYGIHLNGLRAAKASCNTINMELQNGGDAIGIGYFTTSTQPPGSEISSNCISESNTAMHFESLAGGVSAIMPVVLNNYMYNYSDYGVEAINMTGNIGSSPSPALGAGRNSFVSNNGLGLTADIASTNPMTSFGNYGVSFVSGTISIAGNNVNSTASCGHQIDLANSSGGYVEICDDLSNALAGMIINGNGLNNNFATAVPQAGFSELMHVLHLVKNSANIDDIDMFYLEVMSNSAMSDNEKKWFALNYNILIEDNVEALTVLNSIVAEDQEQANLITIERIQLNETVALTSSQVSDLEMIASSDSQYGHLAIALLVDGGVLLEKVYHPTLKANHHNSDISMASVEATSFAVYPNPSTGVISFDYSINEDENANLAVYDMAGKRVALVALTFQHSTQSMDLSALRQGVYTLCIVTDDAILAKSKLVKF